MKTLDRPGFRWGLVAGWVAVNFYLSNQPGVPLPKVPGADKVAHLIEYGILAFLLARAIFPYLRRHSAAVRWVVVVVACSTYAITDEMHQAFVPCRSCDPLDVLADAAGALLVALLLFPARRRPWARRLGVD